MPNCNHAPTARRRFLQSAAAGSLLFLKPETVFGSQANSAIELGIIGCGGRGNWIGGHFVEFTNTRVVALADAFRSQLEATQNKFKVDSSRLYEGLDGYRRLLASRLDAVAIMSPPYFHPEHAAAAVESGKHVFLAKPIAVDVPGCDSILTSGERAKGKVSFLVDFQTRAQPIFQESARRVHTGAIGAPVMGHVFYHAGRLRPKDAAGMSPEEARLRNWVFDKTLSGDIIVEQNIHVLDVANWYLQSHPIKAFGTGGRKARVDVGDCWDHFLVTYWYPDDVKLDFSSAQFVKGFSDLCIRVYGNVGTVDSHYGGAVNITGDNPWKGAEKDDTFRQGAITNVKDFVESIRTRKYLNNAAASVESNLTAIMGRSAAYAERVVTWDEMLQANHKLGANLKL
jgi:myo-inositol 2-dehydrogenase/D-chiro-inositol 1-dehydrogenase